MWAPDLVDLLSRPSFRSSTVRWQKMAIPAPPLQEIQNEGSHATRPKASARMPFSAPGEVVTAPTQQASTHLIFDVLL